MTFVRRLALCGACLAGLAPALAAALELGPIEARSALYQPLDARIPVRGAQSGDLQGLNVTLGSPAQFELAGVARLQHLGLLEFVVVEEGGGDGYIHVRTDEPIIEPSLTFLIDVDWPRGRTVRGYKVYLASVVGGATDAAPSRGAAPDARPETGGAPSPPASGGAGYGPVRKSETLWSIASRLRPDTSVSTQRMMLAILEANPGAFAIGNVNALRAGATLRIPSRDEIGPDDLDAALAEVRRQHSEWLDHRKPGSARAAPALPDSGTEPGGRIEVVSPEATADTTGQEGGAGVAVLRRELALAMEEVDAVRRENDELKLRLADAEDHIGELNRFVELKNEEIAALQSELSARSGTMPAPDPGEAGALAGAPDRVGELNRLVELKNEEIAALRAELSARSETAPAPGAAPAEAERSPPAPAPAEPKPLPFGLGSLPVNPVFLVGGAGLLLLLLGVLALLRRRRTSSGAEEDVPEASEASPSEDDGLLFELEAVAAELADDRGDSPERRPDRHSRSVPAADPDGGVEPESRTRDVAGSEHLAEARIAELWPDEDDRTPERELPADTDAKAHSAEITFDIDALAADDSVRGTKEDESGDELDIADAAMDRETDSARTGGEAGGGLDRLSGRREAGAADSGAPGPAPADADTGVSEMTDEGVGRRAGAVAGEGVGFEREPDDTDGSEPQARSLPGEPAAAGGTGEVSLEDVGEDEVQTKIDLAQVYMEMGDTESARGFLEAVLAEGDAEQRNTAREMLSKLA